MRWRRQHGTDRPPRPKLRTLTAEERERLAATMTDEVGRSPVLSAFQVRVRPLRGRFYLEWRWDAADEESPPHTHGRISPLDDPNGRLLLEVEHGRNRWSEVASGPARKLIRTVAADKRGTFHGLGSLDESLRRAKREGLERLPVRKSDRTAFAYADTKETCTVQEALYHYFDCPVQVVAQPRLWYFYRRTPKIVECSEDRTRVLVRFLSSSWSGETFGGTCLYLKRDGDWGAWTIRPNQSQDIATAERWLVKRKWRPWC